MYRFHGCDPAILRQILVESGLKYTQNGRSYIFTCPLCSGKKKLFIRKRDGRFVCWKCKETQGYQGRPEYALADLLGQPVGVVSSRLYGGQNVPVAVYLDVHVDDFFGDDDDEEDFEPEVLEVRTWPSNYYPIDDPFGARGAAYLEGRGIPIKIATQYGIHYCPEERRVAFPVASHGDLYGWQGRLVVPHEYVDERGEWQEALKIQSSTGVPRERTLMFSDRLDGHDHAVLAEGPIDAIKAHLCEGNVSPMGKAVNPEQIGLLLNHGVKKLYLGLDPDAAEETMRLVRNYYDDVEIYRMLAKVNGRAEKADLGGMTFEEVYDLYRGAQRVGPGEVFVFVDGGVPGQPA